jgi:hypothetical protein
MVEPDVPTYCTLRPNDATRTPAPLTAQSVTGTYLVGVDVAEHVGVEPEQGFGPGVLPATLRMGVEDAQTSAIMKNSRAVQICALLTALWVGGSQLVGAAVLAHAVVVFRRKWRLGRLRDILNTGAKHALY